MIKILSKVGIGGSYLNRMKAIYNKPIADIILNVQKLKVFPLRSGIRQGRQLSPLLFNIVLEALATAIRQEEEIKLLLFIDDLILHRESNRDSVKKLLD